MLDLDTPAEIIPFLYPDTKLIVRTHKQSEDNSIWLSALDVCTVLSLTNTTYACSKLDLNKVLQHKAHTSGGKQLLT